MSKPSTHPRLGQLVRNGRTIYYATLAGGVYVEHTDAEEVLAYINAEKRGAVAEGTAKYFEMFGR